MSLTPNSRTLSHIQLATAIFSLLVALFVLTWQMSLPPVSFFDLNFSPMRVNTAIGILCLSLAFVLMNSSLRFRWRAGELISAALAAVAMTIGGLTWAQYAFGVDLGIDRFFADLLQHFRDPQDARRMSVFAARCMTGTGVALLLLHFRSRGSRILAQAISFTCLVLAFYVLLNFLYRTEVIAQIGGLSHTVWLTALTFFVFNFGILHATADVGAAAILFSRGYGGYMARRLLLGTCLVLPILGWLRLRGGQAGLYSHEAGTSVVVVSTVLLFIAMTLWTARRLNRLQEDLSTREQVFKYLVEGTRDYAIVMLDHSGNIQSWNIGAERLTGYHESEAVGQPITILHTPEAVAKKLIASELREAEQSGKWNQEIVFLRKDGTRFWGQVTTTRIDNERGEMIGFANVVQDVTDRRNSEEMIKRSEAQFRTLANSIPQITWMTDESGAVTWYNQRWYDYTGFGTDQVGGWGWLSVQHPDHRDRVLNGFKNAIETKQPWEDTFPLRGQHGEWRWFLSRANPVFDDGGKVIAWFGTNTDVTGERRSQEEREVLLKELESKTRLLETVLEQMPAAVVIAEAPSGKIVFGNRQVDVVWRHPLRASDSVTEYAEWVGFHPDGRRIEGQEWPLARSLEKGEIVVNEDADVLRGDGTMGIIRLNSAPVKNSRGEIMAGVVICEDVTELRRAQKDLLRAKDAAEAANQAKSEFLANMSHEIRTPMNAVLGFSDLLLEEDLTESERRDYLRRIRSSGSHLIRLIDDILDLSRVDAGRLQIEKVQFSIVEVVNGVFDALSATSESKGLELKLVLLSPVPLTIWSDPSRLRQILINLVGNSVKFTERGSVEVRLRFVPSADLAGHGSLEIEIADTGIGIKAEAQRNLFQLFGQADSSVTRKYGGTGLGLALSRKLTQALGGDLSLKSSEPGKGSCFTLRVPVGDVTQVRFIEVPAAAASPVSAPERSQISGSSKPRRKQKLPGVRVLLAEDSPDNVMLMKVYLEAEGARIAVAHDGFEAIAAASRQEFDVILMDIQMPNLGGLEATRRLRAQNYRKPILAVTAHALKDEINRSIEAGCNDHITKPVGRRELIEAIQRHSSMPLQLPETSHEHA
jgi:PAS domain S-box-containing protein